MAQKRDRIRTAALMACELLVQAYDQGEADGGSMEWESVDEAHRAAVDALAMCRASLKKPGRGPVDRGNGTGED